MISIVFAALFFLLQNFSVVLSVGLPGQISLSYGASATEMVVTWASSISSKEIVCEYGTSPQALKTSVIASKISSYTYLSYTSPYLYEATISNLIPGNSIYYYRVGSVATGYSEIYSFKSNPGVGKAVTFHLIGDLGQTVDNSVNTLKELVSNEEALTTLSGGIISMGDLSYANGNEPLWDSFANMKQFAAAQIPMSTTLGNHEWFDTAGYNFTAYRARYFNPPVNGAKELYYSFNAGLVHWVMVAGYCPEMKTTSTQPCLAAGSPQMQWLEKDLGSVDRLVTPWVCVVFHEPYINSNTAHSMSTEGYPMQAAIESTLYKYEVDIVFSGHVHAYERSHQVYQYKNTPGAPWYITIGDGGNAEGLASGWIQPQPEWSAFRQASYGHGELNVVNATHAYWQWYQNADLTPLVPDSYWYVKGSAQQPDASTLDRVTKEAVFANNDRGARAAKFNEIASKVARPN